MKVLVTGSAGFIGFHLTKLLLDKGYQVIGIDNLNNYYDVRLKLGRLLEKGIEPQKIAYNEPVKSNKYENYTFIQLSIENAGKLERVFAKTNFDIVCHLAAQAGVRYSVKNPEAYLQSNIIGFFNILEACRHFSIKKLVYASSSSIYGGNEEIPYKEGHRADMPLSFYGATKKSNELMAYSYSHIYGLKTTGLRFFTAYGPWGRPDMAVFLFTKNILEGKPIMVFNNGDMSRDFTFVGDIVEGIHNVMFLDTKEQTKSNYNIYNIGNSKPTNLLTLITTIEETLGKKAKKDFKPLQDGDMKTTFADISNLIKDFNYKPKTSLEEGIKSFVDWYLDYYKVSKVIL